MIPSISFSQSRSSNKILSSIIINKNSGFYNEAFYFKAFSLYNDDLRFTTDGSNPSINSPILPDSIFLDQLTDKENYFSEIQNCPDEFWEPPRSIIDKAHILKIYAFREGSYTGESVILTYFIGPAYNDKIQLPIFSLITDPDHLFSEESGIYVPGDKFDNTNPLLTGNYFQRGDDWERPVHIHYFDRDKVLRISQNAGIRIHGGITRKLPQKSLRLYARSEYGINKFYYPFLPGRDVDAYKRILLRSTMGSWNNSVISDVVAHQIIKESGLDYQEYQPALVFINGEFWGIYTIRDRIDERYISYLHGIDKDFVNMVEGTHANIVAGDNTSYLDMIDFIENHNLAIDQNYEYVSSVIDIDNYIDYLIAEIYFKNYDWPTNNIKIWNSQKEDIKWKWIFYDIDGGYGDMTYNMVTHLSNTDSNVEWPNSPESTLLYRKLIENQKFRESLLSKFSFWMKHYFNPDENQALLKKIKNEYAPYIPMHINRWNYPSSYEDWEDIIADDLAYFLEHRPCNIEYQLAQFFQLDTFDGNCIPAHYPDSDPYIISPNPFQTSLYIFNRKEENARIEISIYTIDGKQVFYEAGLMINANQKHYIHLNHQSQASLILRINDGKNVYTRKIIQI